MRLYLVTFGRVELHADVAERGTAPVAVSGKPLALLCRLAFGSAQTLSREALAEELWSDLDPSHAKAQLRNALWILRTHAGPDLICANDTTVSLSAPIASDRGDFEEAVRAQKRPLALDLYRGDFLGHFAVPGARGFEEWAELQRRHLKGLFVATAEAEVRDRLRDGRFREATDLARRIRDAEPLSQQTWRLLLRALTSIGDFVSARAEAAALEELVGAEGLSLDNETRIAIRIAKSDVPPKQVNGDVETVEAELVGRERELAQLLMLGVAAARGAPRVGVVTGPPGIGKTRLVRDFARAMTLRRCRVLTLAAGRTTARVAYGTVARATEMIASLPGALGVSEANAAVLITLNPALSSVFRHQAPAPPDADSARVRLLALAELVRGVCAEAPLTLIVDDAQWLDDASRQAFDSLPELCAGSPLLLIYAERNGRSEASAEPVPHRRLSLTPLDRSACEALVASIARIPAEPWTTEWLDAIHAVSGGVPLAILDVLKLARERRVATVSQGAWSAADATSLVKLTIESAPRRARVLQLPADARQIMTLVESAGAPVDTDAVRAVLALSGDAFQSAMSRLTERGMAHVTDGAVQLDHDEYGAAARDASAPEERRALLHALAHTLAARHDADQLRRAYNCADQVDDEELATAVAQRFVAIVRAAQPTRSTREILADLMGLGAKADRLDGLERRFDTGRRMRRRAQAVAVFAALALVIGYAAWWSGVTRTPPPDVEVSMMLRDSAGALWLARAPITLNPWQAGRALVLDLSRRQALGFDPPRDASESPTARGRWVGIREHEPPFLDDLVIIEPDGRERTVARAPGDDVTPSWSPDGRRVVFLTARWARREWSDIAIVNVDSETIQRVTDGTGTYASPTFSSDGTGIAYLSGNQQRRAEHVCVMNVGSGRRQCRPLGDSITPVGRPTWISPSSVRYALRDGVSGATRILSWNLDTGVEQAIGGCAGDAPATLLAGLVMCGSRGDGRHLVAAPALHLDQWRPVELRGVEGYEIARMQVADLGVGRSFYHALRIVGNRDATVAVPQRLLASARRADSSDAPVPEAQWEVVRGDATIDASGTLTAHAEGEVLVRARVGQLLEDSIVVRVRRSAPATVLDERWGFDWLTRWRRFGVPLPLVIKDSVGRAFWNAGDGNYYSGAYMRDLLDFTRGLAVDAVLETRINRDTEQRLSVRIIGGTDTPLSSPWDHRTGWPRIGDGRLDCAFEYPVGSEGPGWGQYVHAAATGRAPTILPSGKPYWLRLQLFPDGRCAAAVNGRVMGISTEPTLPRPVRVAIYGSSVGTRILVRSLRVTAGVPAGVDWTRKKP